jgi:hypothetical protein
MKNVGCDLRAREQTIAMLDTETGEFRREEPPFRSEGALSYSVLARAINF